MVRLTALLLLTAAPAWAQMSLDSVHCAQRDEIVPMLENQFTQTRQAMGYNGVGRFMEIWADEEAGTWTFIITRLETGQSCVMAEGRGWVPTLPPLSDAPPESQDPA